MAIDLIPPPYRSPFGGHQNEMHVKKWKEQNVCGFISSM